MLDIRKRIFIGIGIVTGLIIAIILWYLYAPQGVVNPNTQPNNGQNTEGNETVGNTSTSTQNVPVVKENLDEVYAKQVARMFVERFATYSNQNDNRNIEDAVAMSTEVMAKWLKTQIVPLSNDYSGVTTKVIASNIVKIDQLSAKVAIEAQQVWENANSREIKQRTGSLDLVKVGTEWKVDGFYWDKE